MVNKPFIKRSDTAILFFARSPGVEGCQKLLLHSPLRNREILSLLTNHALSIIQENAHDHFVWDESMQLGSTFGARFAHAFQSLFDKGYAKVISVGNDCPLLTQNDLDQAKGILDGKNELVLGPATDGGVYLLGMESNCFNFNKFSKISWQTSKVFKQLLSYSGKPAVLQQKADIDTSGDIVEFLAHANSSILGKLIGNLLFHCTQQVRHHNIEYKSSLCNQAFHSRPPPLRA